MSQISLLPPCVSLGSGSPVFWGLPLPCTFSSMSTMSSSSDCFGDRGRLRDRKKWYAHGLIAESQDGEEAFFMSGIPKCQYSLDATLKDPDIGVSHISLNNSPTN